MNRISSKRGNCYAWFSFLAFFILYSSGLYLVGFPIFLLLESILFTVILELDPAQFPANCKIWALESNSCNIDAIECSSDADSTLLFVMVVLQFKNHHQIGKKYVPIFDQNQLQKWLKITLCNIYIRLRPTHIYITPAMLWIYEFVNSLSLLL